MEELIEDICTERSLTNPQTTLWKCARIIKANYRIKAVAHSNAGTDGVRAGTLPGAINHSSQVSNDRCFPSLHPFNAPRAHLPESWAHVPVQCVPVTWGLTLRPLHTHSEPSEHIQWCLCCLSAPESFHL